MLRRRLDSMAQLEDFKVRKSPDRKQEELGTVRRKKSARKLVEDQLVGARSRGSLDAIILVLSYSRIFSKKGIMNYR